MQERWDIREAVKRTGGDPDNITCVIKGEMIHAMCLGDDEDVIVLEYVK